MVCVHLYVQQSCPSLAYGDRVNRVSFIGEIRFKEVSSGMRIMCINLGHFCGHMASIVAVYARFTLINFASRGPLHRGVPIAMDL